MTADGASRLLGNGAHGADFRAGAALRALFFVDDVLGVTLLDGLNGALSRTGAAADALAADFVSHDSNLHYVCLDL